MTNQILPRAEASHRIFKLQQLINDYRYHYHVLDESIMSEAAADYLNKNKKTVFPFFTC